MIVSFGSLAFKAGYSGMLPITELQRKLAVEKDDQDQDGGKPATLIKGIALEELSFKVKLLRIFPPTPETVIERLERMIANKTPERLLIGGKVMGGNRWLLTGCDISYSQLDAKGKIVEAEISLSFSEFIREGANTKDKGSTAAAPGIKPSFGVKDAYRAPAYTVEEKAVRKRLGGPLQME